MRTIKVKLYNCKIIKGLQYYAITKGDSVVFRSLDGTIEQTIKSKHFIKAKFAFKRVKYLTPSELVGLSKLNSFRQWASNMLDKLGFNYN